MLELNGIHRRFGDVVALDDVSIDVPAGRSIGFVGRNGAGKTTTMRVALGLVEPDRGEIRWQGRPITDADRLRIGYMPEERGLYPGMSALEQLVHLARLAGWSRTDARRRAGDLLEELELHGRATQPVQELSLGNQQRVQLAAALVHEPEILVLDEPFSGLDPIGVDVLAATLAARRAAGVGLLFSSHQLELVERMCDLVVMIDAGRIVDRFVVGDGERGSLGDRFREVVGR